MLYISLELPPPQSGPVIKQYFLLNELEQCFFIERDKIDQEQYLKKIPFCSFEQDGISQKLNLAHAWSPVQTALSN
jgi:hypothetical protein